MAWLTLGLSVTASLLFVVVRWWLRRSARQEGREEVKLANLEGESDAQEKGHKARNWWHTDPAALGRMHDKYRRKRKDRL